VNGKDHSALPSGGRAMKIAARVREAGAAKFLRATSLNSDLQMACSPGRLV
jgi:hypothetical protein